MTTLNSTDINAGQGRIEDLEHDLDLMMRSRKVLWQGLGKVLMACGNYIDCQERGGDYPLERAMQDVMDASRETWVEFNRMMDGALEDV